MRAKITGTVLKKEHRTNGKEGMEKKDYYKFLVFTGDTDNAEVSCDNKQFSKVKEGEQVTVDVNIMAVKRFDSANLYVKQLAV